MQSFFEFALSKGGFSISFMKTVSIFVFLKNIKKLVTRKKNCDFCSWPTVDFEYMIKIGDF